MSTAMGDVGARVRSEEDDRFIANGDPAQEAARAARLGTKGFVPS